MMRNFGSLILATRALSISKPTHGDLTAFFDANITNRLALPTRSSMAEIRASPLAKLRR